MILERSKNLVAEAIYGENIGGVPSHEQMITSKIEEKSGDVVPIGWQHWVDWLPCWKRLPFGSSLDLFEFRE